MSWIAGAFLVVVVIALSIGGAAAFLKATAGFNECNLNSDCPENNYCGSDFKCHSFPVIENTIVNNDWTTPAAIIGLAIVLSALILRKRQPTQKQFY